MDLLNRFGEDLILDSDDVSKIKYEVSEFLLYNDVDLVIEWVSKTSKSVFGKGFYDGGEVFFKVAIKDRILGEINGFVIGNDLPHAELISYGVTENIGYYIQNYIDSSMIASDVSNRCVFNNEDVSQYICKYENIFSVQSDLFSKTIVSSRGRSKNDVFFIDRLVENGRFFKYYNLGIIIDDLDVRNYNIQLYNDEVLGINKLFQSSKILLSENEPKYFGISHGDPTEANFSLDGFFFDFETTGMNSFCSDIAIFVVYCCYSSFLFSLRYNTSFDFDKRNLGFSFEHASGFDLYDDSLLFYSDFEVPESKLVILKSYINVYIKEVEKHMTNEELNSSVSRLKMYIFLRLVLVRNLNNMSIEDICLSMYLVGVFMSSGNENSISEYLNNRILNL